MDIILARISYWKTQKLCSPTPANNTEHLAHKEHRPITGKESLFFLFSNQTANFRWCKISYRPYSTIKRSFCVFSDSLTLWSSFTNISSLFWTPFGSLFNSVRSRTCGKKTAISTHTPEKERTCELHSTLKWHLTCTSKLLLYPTVGKLVTYFHYRHLLEWSAEQNRLSMGIERLVAHIQMLVALVRKFLIISIHTHRSKELIKFMPCFRVCCSL